jgi:hypothetical protein
MAIDAHEKSPGESPGLFSFPCEQPSLSVSNKRSICLERRDPKIERDGRPDLASTDEGGSRSSIA